SAWPSSTGWTEPLTPCTRPEEAQRRTRGSPSRSCTVTSRPPTSWSHKGGCGERVDPEPFLSIPLLRGWREFRARPCSPPPAPHPTPVPQPMPSQSPRPRPKSEPEGPSRRRRYAVLAAAFTFSAAALGVVADLNGLLSNDDPNGHQATDLQSSDPTPPSTT